MNVTFKTAGALFATLALLGVTLTTVTSAASANPSECQTACSFRIGHPPATSNGANELGLQFHT
jgi:hypothetical protein